jgi:hypothetical protein
MGLGIVAWPLMLNADSMGHLYFLCKVIPGSGGLVKFVMERDIRLKNLFGSTLRAHASAQNRHLLLGFWRVFVRRSMLGYINRRRTRSNACWVDHWRILSRSPPKRFSVTSVFCSSATAM